SSYTGRTHPQPNPEGNRKNASWHAAFVYAPALRGSLPSKREVPMRRREFLASVPAVALLPLGGATAAQRPPQTGRLKQALFRSAFDPTAPFEDVCRTAADLGVHGLDAIESKDWPTLKRFGLKPTLAYPEVTPIPFTDGIARSDRHEQIEALLHAQIDLCAREGCGIIPVAGGQRRGMSYEEGADNTVAFFNRIKAHAEEK